MRLLVVTATLAERDAVLRDLGLAQLARLPPYPDTRVVHPGVGTVVVLPAGPGVAAAVAAGIAVHRLQPDVVLSAGLARSLRPGLAPGIVVLADTVAAVDRQGGPPAGRYAVPGPLLRVVHDRAATAEVPLAVGAVLSVATLTTRADLADALRASYPDALAEAVEGWGVTVAARAHGKPALELRAVTGPAGVAESPGVAAGVAESLGVAAGAVEEAALEADLALDGLARAAAALFAREWRPTSVGD